LGESGDGQLSSIVEDLFTEWYQREEGRHNGALLSPSPTMPPRLCRRPLPLLVPRRQSSFLSRDRPILTL